jgi:photosystem II stability/assembly factor-like uncharacterized protein
LALSLLAATQPAGAASRASSPTENLYSVHMLEGGSHAWAVGAFGSVFHSSDGGITWTPQSTPVRESLFDVLFVDRDHGLAVGQSGVILRASAGGRNWVRVKSNTEKHLFKIRMIDRQRGWAVGDWGVILSTADGGVTWTDRSLAEDVVLSSVTFVDHHHGWIVGEGGMVLATTDGGQTWQRQNPGTEKTLFGVAFTSRENGWVVGIDGLVLRTKDGGATWEIQRGTVAAGSLQALGFLDLLHNPGLYDVAMSGPVGCIVGDTGTVLVTTDGGETWAPHSLPEDVRLLWLRGVSVTPQGDGVIVGAQGVAVPLVDGELREPRSGNRHAAQAGR